MTARSLVSILLAVALTTTSGLAAQSFAPSARSAGGPVTSFRALLEDGRLIRLEPRALDGESFRFEIGDGSAEQIGAGALVALHGPAPRPRGRHVVTLVGGEVLRGEIRGGDDLGDSFTLQSDVLGEVVVPIDRLERLRFVGNRPEAEESQLGVPEGADEALFVGTPRGIDRITGEILRFTRRAIRFQADGDEKAVGWLFTELVALVLDGGYDREKAPGAWLTTTSGDRIGVDRPRIDGGEVSFLSEGGEEHTVPLNLVSALSFTKPGRRFLSALEPTVVEQRSYFSERPLYRMRTDRAVDGSLLAVGALGGGTGFGVHSRTEFEVVVPDGANGLVGGVGLDDSVEALKVRPSVSVSVRAGEKVLFERSGLRPGELAALGRLAVEPGQALRFVVDFGPGLDLGDRVDWLDCAFVRRP